MSRRTPNTNFTTRHCTACPQPSPGPGGHCPSPGPGPDPSPTGPTGPICEQAILFVKAAPPSVGIIGEQLTFYYKTTNVSGITIPGPIIVSSSLLGNMLLQSGNFAPGQTIERSFQTMVTQAQLMSSTIISNDFVGRGQLNGNQYSLVSRLSPTSTITIGVNNTDIDVTGSIIITSGTNITVNLGIENTGSQPITVFAIDLSKIFTGSSCNVSLAGNPGNIFNLNSSNVLSLINGNVLNSGHSVRGIRVTGTSCNGNPSMCETNACSFTYTFSTTGGPTITGSRTLSIHRT